MIMDALKYRKARIVSKAEDPSDRGSHSILFNKGNIDNSTSLAKEDGKHSQSAKKVSSVYIEISLQIYQILSLMTNNNTMV